MSREPGRSVMGYFYVEERMSQLLTQHCALDRFNRNDPTRFYTYGIDPAIRLAIERIPKKLEYALNRFPPELIPVINWRLDVNQQDPIQTQLRLGLNFSNDDLIIGYYFAINTNLSYKSWTTIYKSLLNSVDPMVKIESHELLPIPDLFLNVIATTTPQINFWNSVQDTLTEKLLKQ